MAAFLVAAASRIERGMGEVEEVPGVTEQDLRDVIIEQITAICDPLLPMEPDEVSVADVMKVWGRPIASTRAMLDREVENGKLTKRKALNPETGRECWAYKIGG